MITFNCILEVPVEGESTLNVVAFQDVYEVKGIQEKYKDEWRILETIIAGGY